MVDHSNDLAGILALHGERRSVVGSVDTGILTRCAPQEVRAEVRRCMDLGRRFPGFFMRAAGDVPHNVPLADARAYFSAKAEFGCRG